MYGVIGKCRKHNLAVDCTLDMFDRIVKPVMLYGCEVSIFDLKKNYTENFVNILKVKPSTPNFMVYGELGRFPVLINIKV